jgi:hypothetical protein
MAWLLSFRYYAVFKKPDGSLSRVGPNDTFDLTEDHPAAYIAEVRQRYLEVSEGPYDPRNNRADDITRLYSATEVPAGTLSEEAADLLS